MAGPRRDWRILVVFMVALVSELAWIAAAQTVVATLWGTLVCALMTAAVVVVLKEPQS